MTDVHTYADLITAEIDGDIAEGALPARVRTFGELHDYVDANDYLIAAQVPYDGTPATIDVVVAVQDEVTRRLSGPGRPYCTYGACTYPRHDHTTSIGADGEDLQAPVPMRCRHCQQPSHYDEKLHRYRHDDPSAADCFLIHEPNPPS
ncbi:hypothetical protein ACN27G_29125 [Plantactinospora sp. WMMB334]|uniref:hypothetical protein n=1 Tax=Plantactinospora sp. WMMB334 TaxID=3404119 RepID=UPI003B95D14B